MKMIIAHQGAGVTVFLILNTTFATHYTISPVSHWREYSLRVFA